VNRSCGVISSLVVFGLLAVGAREGVAQTVVQGKPVGPFDAYVAPDVVAQSHSSLGRYVVPATAVGCPVGLQAQRGSSAGMVVTHRFGDHGPLMGIAQQLHMTLTNPGVSDIVGVTLVVHGLTATMRMSPALQAGSGDAGTISRTVQLGVNLGARKKAVTDLTVDSFTAVTRVDLVAVAYQDGSAWHALEKQTCRITPDLYMPVDVARVP